MAAQKVLNQFKMHWVSQNFNCLGVNRASSLLLIVLQKNYSNQLYFHKTKPRVWMHGNTSTWKTMTAILIKISILYINRHIYISTLSFPCIIDFTIWLRKKVRNKVEMCINWNIPYLRGWVQDHTSQCRTSEKTQKK